MCELCICPTGERDSFPDFSMSFKAVDFPYRCYWICIFEILCNLIGSSSSIWLFFFFAAVVRGKICLTSTIHGHIRIDLFCHVQLILYPCSTALTVYSVQSGTIALQWLLCEGGSSGLKLWQASLIQINLGGDWKNSSWHHLGAPEQGPLPRYHNWGAPNPQLLQCSCLVAGRSDCGCAGRRLGCECMWLCGCEQGVR